MVETCQEVEALHSAALGEGLVVKANPQVPLLGLLLPKYATSGRGGTLEIFGSLLQKQHLALSHAHNRL